MDFRDFIGVLHFLKTGKSDINKLCISKFCVLPIFDK